MKMVKREIKFNIVKGKSVHIQKKKGLSTLRAKNWSSEREVYENSVHHSGAISKTRRDRHSVYAPIQDQGILMKLSGNRSLFHISFGKPKTLWRFKKQRDALMKEYVLIE